jgi:retron-type reverse transcriptase
VYRFRTFVHQVSERNTKTVWVLKCDIRKFFASIDQKLLLELLAKYIPDQDIIILLTRVVQS